MKGWLILSFTLAIGFVLGVGAMVATAQGPMLVTFTQRVAELDLLLEPGDRVELITPGYATFVEDPTLERVKKSAGAVVAPSPPSTSSGSPQGSQEKTVR